MANEGDLQRALASLQPRGIAPKLRGLMPALDQRVKDGVEHAALVAALNQAGIPIKLNTFRVNLFRWRKAQSVAALAVPVCAATPPPVPALVSKPIVSLISSDSNSGGRPQTPRIENKGDMKRARQNFDFDELAAAADKNDTDQ